MLGLSLALLVPRPSAAQREFDVPSECGSAADFRRQLEALAPGIEAPEPSVLQIRPERSGGFRLHLELLGEVRELVDPDCPTLLRSAVVITLAAARTATPTPVTSPAPVASSPAAPTRPAPRPEPAPRAAAARGVERGQPRTSPATSPRASFALGAGVGITGGSVPGASAAFELRAGFNPAPVGGALTLRYWPGSSAERQGRTLDVVGVGARAAAVVALGSVLHAALGLEVDRLSGSGPPGVPGRNSDAAWRLAGALDLNVIPWSVEKLRLELGLGAQLALIRPHFLITGFGDVYEVPPVGGAAIIRGVWLFR